jgi:hypothetical protein
MPAQPIQVGTVGWHGTPFLDVQQDPPQTPAPSAGWIRSRLARRPRQGFFNTTSSVLFPPILTPVTAFIAPHPVVTLQAVNRSSVW